MLAVELHCHSEFSHDGVDSVEAMLAQARRGGLDAIAVTDHDTIEGGERAVELAPEYGLIGIVGVEVSSEAGHVLGLGVSEPIPAGLSFAETVDRIHEAGGTAVVPHPFQQLRKGVLANISPDALSIADGIEVLNSRFVTGRTNRQARTLATDLGKPMTAGSDAHVSEMVGQTRTLVETEEESADGILAAIRAGRTRVAGSRTPFSITFRQAAGTAKRRTLNRVTGLFQ